MYGRTHVAAHPCVRARNQQPGLLGSPPGTPLSPLDLLTRRSTFSSSAVRCLSRSRTATPDGPRATNGAALSRSPPIHPPPAPTPVEKPRTALNDRHRQRSHIRPKNLRSPPRGRMCRSPDTHSYAPETRSCTDDHQQFTTPTAVGASTAVGSQAADATAATDTDTDTTDAATDRTETPVASTSPVTAVTAVTETVVSVRVPSRPPSAATRPDSPPARDTRARPARLTGHPSQRRTGHPPQDERPPHRKPRRPPPRPGRRLTCRRNTTSPALAAPAPTDR